MRRTDIEVGGLYAFRQGESYGSTHKVEVLEVGVARPTRRSLDEAHVSPDTIHDGVRVRFPDNPDRGEVVVQGRTIRRTWAEHEAIEEEREQRLREKAEAHVRLENKAKDVIDRLSKVDIHAIHLTGSRNICIRQRHWDDLLDLLDRAER